MGGGAARAFGGGAARASGIAALLAASALLLAGCDTQPRPAPSATALPQGVTARIEADAAADTGEPRVLVVVRNNTDEVLVVKDLRVDDPRFLWAAWGAERDDVRIPARSNHAIPIGMPSMVCPAAIRATTRVTVDFALGASIAVASLKVADHDGAIAAVNEAQCAARN